ncbi:hypothetical protein GF312_13870 [Candidatus Poribacteria bacterium]|nr:hypothetical protein [Candidatus Poribacteria bacterium]
MEKRYILKIDAENRSYTLDDIDPQNMQEFEGEDYSILWGEALAQYLLRQNPEYLVIARGPLVRFPATKTTVGYISPMTSLPHYSFVGGNSFREIWSLGLAAVIFTNPLDETPDFYVDVSGEVPDLQVRFVTDENLPKEQRSAYYYLVSKELDGHGLWGSVYTLGNAAYNNYLSANIAVEAIYHAGRGGAGFVMGKFAKALVLHSGKRHSYDPEGLPLEVFKRLDKYGSRLSCKDAGTIIKLAATGKDPAGKNTLPALNAQKLGYPMAEIAEGDILLATREGKTGCYWCPVTCRHFHTMSVDYSPNGKDKFLDDFEPAYSVYAMLNILAEEDTKRSKIKMLEDVDREIFLLIEQMGLDVIDVGVGISALYEGISRGIIPLSDVPEFLHQRDQNFGSIEKTHRVLDLIKENNHIYKVLSCIGDGPQALVKAYPEMQDYVFTCGKGTLGNAGHCNKLWTFLMPFSRFFSHYSGQIYKVSGNIPDDPNPDNLHKLFTDVVNEMFKREYFSILCNVLSCCAFGFVIFTEDGKGIELDRDELLVDVLKFYDIQTSRRELMRFARNFWAQSTDFKIQHGWKPLKAQDFPHRIYEAVSQAISHPPEKCHEMMDILIQVWKQKARQVMNIYGYQPDW